MSDPTSPKQRGSETLWLDAASEMLCEAGVDAVKIMPLAKRLNLSRTGFYWHFENREALLQGVLDRWEARNSRVLIARTEAYAETVCEAMFNLFDCFLENGDFDARLDLAVRNWARAAEPVQARIDAADQKRRDAVAELFMHFGYSQTEAEVRTMTVLYTLIGYVSMQIDESRWKQLARIPDYVAVFTGQKPSESEVGRFMSRHLSA